MDKKEIFELLKYGERVNLECKEAGSEIPKSVWETYSSFANTSGGVILLGVQEHQNEIDFEKRFTICGVQNPERRIRDFWNTVNSEKVNHNILMDSDVGRCEMDEGTVIWIHVPQANYAQKPVFINGNPYKGSFRRNHEGDYHCTEDDVKAMIRDANDSGNDGSILEGYTFDDIDRNALRSYRIEFEHQNPDHIWNTSEDLEFLKNMGGYAVNRLTGKGWLTEAGLLMFGKGLPIRERFDNIRMDFIDESNLLPGARWSDRVTYDGTWENNLYNFMRMIMPKLVFGLKRPFKMNGMMRTDDTPVHRAIREAVVNMLIHSDYHMKGVLKIVKRDDGFLFSNPGNLRLPVREIYNGGHTYARNPRIQTMLRMIGYGENIGSGFPTILSAWGDENWRKPDLKDNTELQIVELNLWMISLMPQECTQYLQSLIGTAYAHMSKYEQLILGTAYLEGSVSNVRMQSILELHPTEISHILSDLVNQGMLIQFGKGRGTGYRINENYKPKPEQTSFSDMEQRIVPSRNKTNQTIYNYVCENGHITIDEVIAITDISTRQGANAALKRLVDMDLLVAEKDTGIKKVYRKK